MIIIRRANSRSERTENKLIEKFRAVVDKNTSLSMYQKKNRFYCIIRRDLAKDYEIEVDASEAPILNKFLKEPEPYESSMAEIRILEEEVFPVNDATKEVFGEDKGFDLKSIKLGIGSSYSDYVTMGEQDLIKFDVKPTLTGLMNFIEENDDSILGFLDCNYIREEGNVEYLNCSKTNLSDNIYSIKLKILASMQQRGFFLQQEHKYYGLQLYIVIESKIPNDDKLLEFLKRLGIDWELIFFRRRLGIHDWTEIECEINSDNLKSYLRAKFESLNYFDVNNINRLITKNNLSFIVADKMASLLDKMKRERSFRLEGREVGTSNYNVDNYSGDEYSRTLKKAEIAAAAKLACAYLGVQKEIAFDRDVSDAEILKYQEELANI
ncbi:MAG: hypothetical protein BAJALOKI1v1_80011 [Promethearchaeota archaeon]|nr:MAG: hypothetical protein BAJALOKI1v1_80011 [Candidatus Lokiarchaeota archaeon]